MKYIKKPVVIEAIQYDGHQECIDEINNWLKENYKDFSLAKGKNNILLKTPLSSSEISEGDFFIRELGGILRIINKEVFHYFWEYYINTIDSVLDMHTNYLKTLNRNEQYG